MDHLDAIHLKLDRADHHLKILNVGLREFTEGTANRIPGQFNPESKEYVFYTPEASFLRLNREWAPVMGDVIHNLYATLDYIACALFRSNPLNTRDCTTATAFPVFPSEREYIAGAKKKISGIVPAAQAVIESLQPFAGGAGPSVAARHPLMQLYRLEQWDKHKILHATIARTIFWIRGVPPHLAPPPQGCVIDSERQAIFARWPAPSDFGVEVYLVTTCRVIFDSRGPIGGEDVLQTLKNASSFIAQAVIPALKPYIR